MMPSFLAGWLDTLTLQLQLTYGQQLGLAFLLGSFTVAALSDLKYLAAQREFLEVWLVFVLAALALDSYHVRGGQLSGFIAVLKWVVILVLSVLSYRPTGVLFRLARGDVAALAAAASLLTPGLVVLLFAAAKVLSVPLTPVLRRKGNVYPFMPVVTLATLVVLAVGWLAR
jgi:hypothetical protein